MRFLMGAFDRRPAAGIAALGLIALLVAGAFAGLLWEGARQGGAVFAAFDPYLARIAGFTLWQAALSTLLSVAPGVLLARAIARHPSFPGRRLLLALFAAPLALPAIVAALGLLALYGRAGMLAPLLSDLFGGTWGGIYGLSGILVAHVFFNLPLATRLFLQALDTVPADQFRLAAQLGMRPVDAFRFIEWPVLRAGLPAISGLIFMLCVTSFTLVLTLGGGPGATTLEVAIYQSLRFDFDPARAIALTAVQLLLTVGAVWVIARLGAGLAPDTSLGVSPERLEAPSAAETALNAALILAGALFVAAPLAAIVVAGLSADLARLAAEPGLRRATLTSLALASAAGLLAVMLGFALAAARHALLAEGNRAEKRLGGLLEQGAGLVLVVPPVIIGSGWFLLMRGHVDPFAMAPVMIVTVNAAMALPFALRILQPAYSAAAARHDRLCASLGIAGLDRLRLVDLPALRRPLVTALAFAMALSLGDLGVVALFGSDAVTTLPWLLLARMGSYRTADAAGIALVLTLLCMGLMLLSERLAAQERRT